MVVVNHKLTSENVQELIESGFMTDEDLEAIKHALDVEDAVYDEIDRLGKEIRSSHGADVVYDYKEQREILVKVLNKK